MSTLDLYSDEFPHSTREGYAAGCRGGACPGLVDNGMSCAQVQRRYAGDYGFAKKIDAGITVREVLDAEKEAANPNEGWVASVVEAAQAHELVGKDSTGELCSCGFKADSILEHIGGVTVAAAEPVEVQPAPEVVKPKAETNVAKHGTPSGYSRGCRDGSQCPGDPDTGKSCLEAYREYQREYAERRKQNGGKPLAKGTPVAGPKPAPAKPAPAPKPPAPAAPSPLDVANAEIERLKHELAELNAQLSIKPPVAPVTLEAAPPVEHAELTLADGLTVTIAVTVGRAA